MKRRSEESQAPSAGPRLLIHFHHLDLLLSAVSVSCLRVQVRALLMFALPDLSRVRRRLEEQWWWRQGMSITVPPRVTADLTFSLLPDSVHFFPYKLELLHETKLAFFLPRTSHTHPHTHTHLSSPKRTHRQPCSVTTFHR
ncbi:hypothetical protein E2C01_032672 [Portunus trituberculatus]|uniref:Uncharacterized protein n=1 Tax=Portunus trituberculatus TaxID=210409 RepID=A0A5B7F1N8_PORTR|nr:hypothetical protein [Portunus trituberculatus]